MDVVMISFCFREHSNTMLMMLQVVLHGLKRYQEETTVKYTVTEIE